MIEIWFADEARIGQKNKITRRWAKRGTRPSAPKDQRTASAYIFGAICPAEGKGAGLVLPRCTTEGMTLHLKEISQAVTPGAHAFRRGKPLDLPPIHWLLDLYGVADWFSDRSAVSLRNILQIAIEQKRTGHFENGATGPFDAPQAQGVVAGPGEDAVLGLGQERARDRAVVAQSKADLLAGGGIPQV